MNMTMQTMTFMINTAELSVAKGYESRSWLCMFCPHGQGRHHIASSGHKWTCLFWLVQRIINPSPPSPRPQPQIARASTLFKQIRVTGCSCQCHHLPEWDHVSSTHPASSNLTWEECGSAGERHFQIWKGRDRRLPCRATSPADVTSRCRFCHSVNQRERWCWSETRRGSVFSWSLHLHGRESTYWKQKKTDDSQPSLPAPQRKLISMLNYSLCQMKDATINVYDWLGIEVWVIVSWGIELDVCLRAVKTKHCLAIVMHFNYYLIVRLCREGHFCID